jgi:hypothetical protein
MTTGVDRSFAGGSGGAGILDRERSIATAGFNRWLVPPAALCIHLCIAGSPVLGLCRHSAGLGCLGHAAVRRRPV